MIIKDIQKKIIFIENFEKFSQHFKSKIFRNIFERKNSQKNVCINFSENFLYNNFQKKKFSIKKLYVKENFPFISLNFVFKENVPKIFCLRKIFSFFTNFLYKFSDKFPQNFLVIKNLQKLKKNVKIS